MGSTFEIPDPEAHFADWSFNIIRPHWNTLGVVSTYLIDEPKTRELRDRLRASGKTHEEAMHHAIHRLAFVDRIAQSRRRKDRRRKADKPYTPPPQGGYAFNDGYIFTHRAENRGIQILQADDASIDACEMIAEPMQLIQPYRLPPDELAEWLRTGIAPEHRKIDRTQVRSETFRFLISA